VTYRLEVRPDVLVDIEYAAQWYEDREPGLGADFVRDAVLAIDAYRRTRSFIAFANVAEMCVGCL